MDQIQPEPEPVNKNEDGYLYHYTSLKSFLGIIGCKTLWATDIKYMNDKREHKIATELVIHEILQLWNAAKQQDPESMATLTWAASFSSQPLYVVCFSEDRGDRLSQWRAYGQDSGVCLAFRKKELQNWCQAYSAGALRKVRYIPDQGDEILKAEIAELLARSKEGRTPELALEAHALAAFHKHEAFEEEMEWRIVSEQQKKTLRYRDRGSLLVPFVEQAFGDELESLLAAVIIGPTVHRDQTEEAVKQFLLVNHLSAVPRTSQIPYRGF